METPRQSAPIAPRAQLSEEAYEDALALAEALQWAAEHAHEVTLTRAEIERAA